MLAALAGALFFFKLGSFSLYDAAETIYGEFVKQIRLTNDWLTLRYNGEIIFDKPPLFFWLATLTTYLIGFHEFALRFPAALCGLLTVLTTFRLGALWYDQRTGFISALVVMTSFLFLVQSRIAEIDILLTLLICAAIFFFYRGYRGDDRRQYWFSYLMMALAVLTKGIIGAALPGLAIFLFLLFKKELGRLRTLSLPAGALIIALVGLPWYLAEWLIHGERFLQFALGFLFLSRFQGVVSGHPGPWYYYLLALVLGFAPYSQFLPFAFIRAWRQRMSDPELLSLSLIIPALLVFSVAQTKLPSYLLPVYPFLAIMVGRLWTGFLDGEQAGMKQGLLLSNLLLAVVAALLIIGFIILGTNNYYSQYAALMQQLLLLAGVLISGCLLSIGAFLAGKYDLSFFSLPAMVFTLAFVLVTQTLPRVEQFKGTRELAGLVAQKITPRQQIAAYAAGNRPGIVFYNQQPIVFLTNEAAAKTFLSRRQGYCFTETGNERRLGGRTFARRGDLVVLH